MILYPTSHSRIALRANPYSHAPKARIAPFDSFPHRGRTPQAFRPRRVILFFLSPSSLTFLALALAWSAMVTMRGTHSLFTGIDLTVDNTLGMIGMLLIPGTIAACFYDWRHRANRSPLILIPSSRTSRKDSQMK